MDYLVYLNDGSARTPMLLVEADPSQDAVESVTRSAFHLPHSHPDSRRRRELETCRVALFQISGEIVCGSWHGRDYGYDNWRGVVSICYYDALI